MIELNLLPDVKKEFIKAQRSRNAVISISTIATIGAGILTLLLLSYVYVAQPLVIGAQTADIKKNEKALKDIPEIDKYLTVQNQLNNIDSLHDGLYVYSRAFEFLQQLNPAPPNNIALSSVVLDKEQKNIEIQGVTRNFQALNVFQDTLVNAQVAYGDANGDSTLRLFEQVTLLEAGISNSNGTPLTNFKFRLTYPEAAFLNTSTNVKVTVPSMISSDADRNAPKEIFGTQPED